MERLHVFSWNSNRSNQCGRRGDLRNRQNILQRSAAQNRFLRHNDRVARTHRRREHTSGPKTALFSACHRTIRTNDENRTLVSKLCGTSSTGEIPAGVSTWRVGQGIGVVDLPDNQNSAGLLGNCQRVTSAKLDIVWGALKVFTVWTKMYH